jgi:hypothetical protein
VLPGLQPRLQTAASAAIAFTAPAVTATVVVASVATTADLLMSASLLQTQQQTWQLHTPPSENMYRLRLKPRIPERSFFIYCNVISFRCDFLFHSFKIHLPFS